MWNLEQLRSVGIEPMRQRIIVVKAAIAYRAAYAPIARRIIEANTPGLSSADVSRFSFKRLKRPILSARSDLSQQREAICHWLEKWRSLPAEEPGLV